MPIWLRKFTFQKLNEFYEKEKQAYEELSNKKTDNKFKIPNPTYSTKARK